MKALIVGAGIGGLATALALRKFGVDCEILEQAPALTTVGAGIQLSPNGVKILRQLGVAEALTPYAVRPRAHLFKNWQTGETMLETPLAGKVEAAFGAPYYHVHRADLLGVLVAAAKAENLRLNCQVTGIIECDKGVAVTLADGEIVTGDIIIGADGIHSLLRNKLFDPGTPRYSGHVAWRGLVPADKARALGFDTYSYIWMGPKRSVVLYYVSGGQYLNWIGMTPSPENWRESWSSTGTIEPVLNAYEGWHPSICDLVAATETPFVTAIYDRDPIKAWQKGIIVLIGDAAHAMLPYHAQGAVQSLEDAWVLARCIQEIPAQSGQPGIVQALQRFESLRKDRADRVQQQSRAAQANFHASSGADVAARDQRFRRHSRTVQDQAFPPGQAWLYSYDAEDAVAGTDAAWRAMNW